MAKTMGSYGAVIHIISRDQEVIIVCDGTDKTAEIARKIDDRF